MQDPEIPPEAEGEEDGGAVGVRPISAAVAADKAPIVKTQAAEFTARRWIRAIAPCWAMVTATNLAAALARALRRATSSPILNRCRRGRMRTHVSSLSSTI